MDTDLGFREAECSLEGVCLLGNLARFSVLMPDCPGLVDILAPDGRRTGAYALREGGVWRLRAGTHEALTGALEMRPKGEYGPRRFTLDEVQALIARAVAEGAVGMVAPRRRDLAWNPDPSVRESAMRAVIRAMPGHAALAVICHTGSNPNYLPESRLAQEFDQHRARAWNGAWATALAAEGIDLDVPPVPGMKTPLLAAAGRSGILLSRALDIAVAEACIAAGADPNGRPDGRVPVHAAFEAGNERMVAALVECGANPDARYPDGGTMLHKLPGQFQSWPEEGMLGMALALIEAGASLEATNAQGRTPLEVLRRVDGNLSWEDEHEEEGDWRMAMGDLLDLYEGKALRAPGM